jgi:hypothetical protein
VDLIQTPLMIAAASIDNARSIDNQQSDTSCVEALIALGTDKMLTSVGDASNGVPAGLTALGFYRRKCRSSDDFVSTLVGKLCLLGH